MNTALESLRLDHYQRPKPDQPLLLMDEVAAMLERDKHQIANADVSAQFKCEVEAFEGALAAGLNEAHALVNGKWFIEELAVRLRRRSGDECRAEWVDFSRSRGGWPDLRGWWQRRTGNLP